MATRTVAGLLTEKREIKGTGDGSKLQQESVERKTKSHFKLALECQLKQDWDGSIAACNAGLTQGPQSGLTYYWRGTAYLEKGDLQRGMSDLQKAAQLDATLEDRVHGLMLQVARRLQEQEERLLAMTAPKIDLEARIREIQAGRQRKALNV